MTHRARPSTRRRFLGLATGAATGERDQGRKNLEHCVRLSHACGGSGVLLVIGRATDGPTAEVTSEVRGGDLERLTVVRQQMEKALFEPVPAA